MIRFPVSMDAWTRAYPEFAVKASHFQELEEVGKSVTLSVTGRMRSSLSPPLFDKVTQLLHQQWGGKLIGGWHQNELVLFTKGLVVVMGVSPPLVAYSIFANSINECRTYEQDLLRLLDGTFQLREPAIRAPIDVVWYTKVVDGGILQYRFSEMMDEMVFPESYPYIVDLHKYIRSFIEGSEAVLVLSGPPGTGKTRLIRRILRVLGDLHAEEMEREWKKGRLVDDIDADNNIFYPPGLNVGYTTQAEVLQASEIYLALLSGHIGALVLEDIDFHLKARKEGNVAMYQLLAASDGLVTGLGGKKVIVSTNLEEITHIDAALIRPGRCFDTLHTRLLSPEEGEVLLQKLGHTVRVCESLSLADLYKYHNTKQT